MQLLNALARSLAQLKGVSPADYCHLETIANKGEDALLLTTGGFISGVKLNGLNAIYGPKESQDAHRAVTDILKFLIGSGHEVDWGFTQDSNESEQMMSAFFKPMRGQAKNIGLDSGRIMDAATERLSPLVRPEHNVIYIITRPDALTASQQVDKIKRIAPQYMAAFSDHANAQPFLGALTMSSQLLSSHNAAVEQVMMKLRMAKYSTERMEAHEIPGAIKRDACYSTPHGWKCWLWGDKARYKHTPEDGKGKDKLINWGGLPLGHQIHDLPIERTDNPAICKVGEFYVAPIMLEMLPDDENWLTELLETIPNSMPFRYRAYIRSNKTLGQNMADTFSQMFSFSDRVLRDNALVAESFAYVEKLEKDRIPAGNISITMATWAKDKAVLETNLATLHGRISAWGDAQALTERGDPLEAVISTIPGYCTTLFAPATLESLANIAKLTPLNRPSAPFEGGLTPLRTKSGKLFPISPRSPILAAFIEIIVAGSGSGKSVYQNAIARDSNYKPGAKGLSRHLTIDVGPSGQGTVKSIQYDLPPNRAHEAVYERMSIEKRHAANPMDLHLGAHKPTAVDRGFLRDFILLLATPQGSDKAPEMMAEMITQLVDASYDRAFDPEEAKMYKPGINAEVDDALQIYPESSESKRWGRRKTWVKVADFLFERGHVREASVAYRYVVPLITDLSSILSASKSISTSFSDELKNTFKMLMSNSAKNYPLLTQPTRIDFDTARYIVLDLNNVTMEQGSQQTCMMYALSAQLGTKKYWLDLENDIGCFRSQYRDHATQMIKDIKEEDLGVTFEEFRRTQGQPVLRSMINRWMAEGRKAGVFVQLVMQQPEHADAEMFGHATLLTLMGTWNKTTLDQLCARVELSETELKRLTDGSVHGPTSEGSSMLIRYNHKQSGWGSQVIYLTKSMSELWSSTTTLEDTNLRAAVEERVGDPGRANEVLCFAFPRGSAVPIVKAKERELAEIGKSNDVYALLADKAIRSWKLLN